MNETPQEIEGIRMYLTEVLIALLLTLAHVSGHWFPWSAVGLTGRDGLLKRPLAYAYGCGWILLAMVFYAIAHPEHWSAVIWLAVFVLAAGTGTMIPRAVKRIGESHFLRHDRDELEERFLHGTPDQD